MPKKKRCKRALGSFAFKSSSRLKADGPSALGNTFYGVDDDNNVWQINPLESFELDGQPFTQQLELEDALTSKKKSNGVAYSEERNDLFIFYNGSVAGSSGKKPGADSGNKFKILWWNQQGPEDSWDWVTGNNGNFGAQSWPTNAAYFDDSLWYFSGNGNDNKLYQLRLAFGDGSAPVVERLYQYDFPGYSNKSGYGDIAIDVERMLLYGSKKNGEFYRVDLKAVELARSNAEASGASGVITVEDAYQQIKNKINIPSPDGEQVVNASLQLSFDADYQTLWGQTYGGIYDADESLYAGAYYLVDTTTGEIEYSGYQSPNEELGLGKGFTDLGGSTSKPLAPTDPVFAVAPGQGVCVSSETSPVPVAEFSFAVDLDREDFEREYPDRAYGPFLLDVDLRGDLSAAGYRPITADSFFFAAQKSSSSDFVIEEIDDALYLSVPNGVTSFRADVQLDPRDQLTGGEQLEFSLQLLDTGRLEQALDFIEDAEECQPEDVPDPCTSTIDAGYFGYVGHNDGKRFKDWSLTSELNIAEIQVEYLPVAKGQVPDGWSKDGVTGNAVAAELAVVYQDQTQSPYLMRGWLDAQYKTKSVMDYAYFYLAEIVDSYGRLVEDVSSLDLSASSVRQYTPEIKPSLKVIGQSAVLLYQSTGVAAPGTGSVSGNAAFWGDDVPFEDRSDRNWLVGGGSRDPVEVGEVCFGEVIAIETDASCDLPGVDDGQAARFQFDVDLDPYGDQPQLYAYEFKADGLSGDGYDFNFDILIDGVVDEGKNIVVDVDKDGRVTGRFMVAPDVQFFQLDVTLDAHQRLTGDEALELVIVSVGDGGALIPASKQSGTASLESLPCSLLVVGEVESVEGTAACEVEGTRSETDATFRFVVEFAPVGSERQRYDYAFGSNKALGGYELKSVDFGSGAGVTVSPKEGEMGKGTIEVPGGVESFEVVVSVEGEEALAGNEALTLRIGDGASEAEGKASLKSEECKPDEPVDPPGPDPEPVVVGEVESVEGTAACEVEGTRSETDATFRFVVEFAPVGSERQRYDYAFGSNKALGGYELKSVDFGSGAGVTVSPKEGEMGKGTIEVPGGVESFEVVVSVEGEEALAGNEALTLRIGDGASEAEGKASLKSEECKPDEPVDPPGPDPEPVVVGEVESVEGTAACEVEGTRSETDATFRFVVEFAPVGSERQRYDYAFGSNKALGGYELKSVDFGSGAGVTVSPKEGEMGKGTIEVPGGVESFEVVVSVEGEEALAGNEALTLRIGDGASEAEGKASLKSEECKPDEPVDPPGPDPEPVVVGEVESVEGTAACEVEGTRSETDATFRFVVEFAPVGSERQRYDYAFGSNKALGGYELKSVDFGSGAGVTVSPKEGEMGKGTIEVPGGVESFEVVVSVEGEEALAGNEALTLRIGDGASEAEGKASLKSEECKPDEPVDPPGPDPEPVVVGEVESVEGTAACEVEGTRSETDATFRFVVEFAPVGSERQRYDYAFGSNKALGGYELKSVDFGSGAGVTVSPKEGEMGKGTIEVPGGVESFEVVVSVEGEEALAGNEALTLRIGDGASEAEGKASLKSEECKPDEPVDPPGPDPEPVVVGEVESVEGTAACAGDGVLDRNQATFIFDVDLSPGSADQDYGYQLSAGGFARQEDYSIRSVQLLPSAEVEVLASSVGDGAIRGDISVAAGVSEFSLVATIQADQRLTGDESLKLKLHNQISEAAGVASLKNSECRPDSSVTAVTGDGYCIISEQDQSMDLEYSFLVDFEPGSPTLYGYELGVDQLSLLADYSIQQMKVTDLQLNPLDVDVDVISGDSESGLVLVGEGVEQALVTVDVQTDGAITGHEALTLTVGDPEAGGGVVDGTGAVGVVEATDDEGVCQGPLPQLPDANLLLLMDDSTSMLSADPSTQFASDSTRLEAQNRIAFYAFEQAAERAGYGFRRKGDEKFESFGDASTDAILNNSTISLAETLRNYELVDDPSDFRRAGDLVVNQITFGYVVDVEESVARSNGDGSVTVQGAAIAERILLTTTPNTVYGDSIKGNKTWAQRDLPQPTPEDLFKGRGTFASNLYSGTEMLGALDGLHTLLKRQLRRTGDGDADSTFVVMTTDGRPERRPWWDKRDYHDGLAIPLPQSLGGDAITTSGLLYDDEGNWRYVRDNDGLRQWPRTQKRLNKSLDQLSERLIDPSRQLQVEAIGLGDDVGVNYETIYTDLFETKTFDKSDSTWTYEFYPSYGLPEFLG